MNKPLSINEVVFYFLLCGGLMSLNGFQALDLIYLLTTIILSGLCLLLKKGTWLALGILIGLSLVWPIYSYFFPCVFRSAQIGEKQEKILLLILCILLFSLVPSWPIRIILMLLVYSASYLRNDSFEFHSLQKNSTRLKMPIGKMRADCVSKTTTLKALKKQKSPYRSLKSGIESLVISMIMLVICFQVPSYN